MPADDPLTPEETAMRALLADPRRLAEWATGVRVAWEATPAGRAAVARQHGALRVGQGKGAA